MLNYTDLTSGRQTALRGKRKKEFEDELLHQTQVEVEACEDYLEDSIRPRISENWEYYKGNLPAPLLNEPSFVDNTCTATVDHYVAACMDAFTNGDTLEIVPDGVTNPTVLKIINKVMNDILDKENDRHSLYHSFFTDAMVSSASVLRPKVHEETKIEKEYFQQVDEQFLAMRQMQLELDDTYESIELVVTKKKEIEITMTEAVDETQPVLEALDVDSVTQTTTTIQYSGYFVLSSKYKTIKVEAVPAENFLINKDAVSIDDARIVGHKSMVTISDLLSMGFKETKVWEVFENCNDDEDPEDNIASQSRRTGIIPNLSSDEMGAILDKSQTEVELFELYIKSSAESDDELSISKLYQVFYSQQVLLSYQETDEVPYVGASPIPMPHMFWGDGMVDRTKSVQRAKTGLLRQIFVYNQMASNPRFEYVGENLVNIRDILNNKPGAGINVKALGSVSPVQMTPLQGNSDAMLGILDNMREAGTGMSFTGQGLAGEVLKAGSSTASAAMILSEGQMVQKKVINNLLQSAIIPLISTIYNMLQENFDEWHVEVDGTKIFCNPNTWPELSDVQIKTPLGSNAKLEQAQKYSNLATQLASAPAGTDLAKLSSPQHIRELLTKSYELMDVADVKYFLADDQAIQQKDELMQGMQQMQQQLQQMQQQMAMLTQQNQVLQQTANAMAQKELEIKDRDSQVKATKAEADMQNMADDQIRKDTMDEAIMQNMADKQSLAEADALRKDVQTEYEIRTGNNLFRN